MSQKTVDDFNESRKLWLDHGADPQEAVFNALVSVGAVSGNIIDESAPGYDTEQRIDEARTIEEIEGILKLL